MKRQTRGCGQTPVGSAPCQSIPCVTRRSVIEGFGGCTSGCKTGSRKAVYKARCGCQHPVENRGKSTAVSVNFLQYGKDKN